MVKPWKWSNLQQGFSIKTSRLSKTCMARAPCSLLCNISDMSPLASSFAEVCLNNYFLLWYALQHQPVNSFSIFHPPLDQDLPGRNKPGQNSHKETMHYKYPKLRIKPREHGGLRQHHFTVHRNVTLNFFSSAELCLKCLLETNAAVTKCLD